MEPASAIHVDGGNRTSRGAKLLLLFGAMALAAVCLGVYFLSVNIQRTNKIDRLVICAQFRGDDKGIDAAFLRRGIDEMTASGSLSWDDAYGAEASFLGCPAR